MMPGRTRMTTLGADEIWDSFSFWSVPAERAFVLARRKARREERKARREEKVEHPQKTRTQLVPFAHVTERSGLLIESDERTETVRLNHIVGSVGKADWFTLSFHPRSDRLRQRWKRAYAVAHGFRGYAPIELYEAEGLFYVVDGHFRVSVARAIGNETIEARVRRWK